MTNLDAIIMGIIQGITEFLPVSSDGHLEIGKHLLGIKGGDILKYDIVVHAATSFATIVVFRKQIYDIFHGLLKFAWNEQTIFATKIIISMIPVGIVGLFFMDQVESYFTGDNLPLVGAMLILTGSLLFFPSIFQPGRKDVGYFHTVLLGIAQAAAVLPGLSRSGSTISTGLVLGIDREKMAKFSFLMVIPPILGKTLLDIKDMISPDPGTIVSADDIGGMQMLLGFITAFLVGLFACGAMIQLVKNGKLWWFGVYCVIMGSVVFSVGKGWIG